MRRVGALVLLAAGLAGCGAEGGEDEGGASDALIGGRAAGRRFPATVYLQEGCSATKVAPGLLLTAAHCAFDPATAEVRYHAGDALLVARDPSHGYERATVRAAHVHPAWQAACEETYCGASQVTSRLDAPDVALIAIDDVLADVPAASVDVRPVPDGAEVTLAGYGCTEGVYLPDTRSTPSLGFARSRTVHADDAATRANYALTPGPGAKTGAGGLCPGDSGGPLYATRRGRTVVVGVNANYTFAKDDPSGLPLTNWHTRLDGASKHDVAGWLTRCGVPVAR